MKKDVKKYDPSCRIDAESLSRFKQQLPDVAETLSTAVTTKRVLPISTTSRFLLKGT